MHFFDASLILLLSVYAKLPSDISQRWVLLLDPMLGTSLSSTSSHLLLMLLSLSTATGGSALQAIDVLISHGCVPERILFLNLVASPEGLQNVYEKFPSVRCVSAWVDDGLDERNYSELSCVASVQLLLIC